MLAEHSSRSGNFPTITRVLLKKLAPGDAKMSYSYDKCVRCVAPIWWIGMSPWPQFLGLASAYGCTADSHTCYTLFLCFSVPCIITSLRITSHTCV